MADVEAAMRLADEIAKRYRRVEAFSTGAIMANTFTILVSAIALSVGGAASAAIYTYTEASGDVLTLNTTTQTGTIVGASINASFSSPGLAGFSGGADPTASQNLMLANLTGTRTFRGATYNAIPWTHPAMINWDPNGATGTINFWAAWQSPTDKLLGDYTETNTGYTPPSSSSSTGGNTSSGGTGSSGGSVPEPADFALFALGVAGLLFGRRQLKLRSNA